MRGLIAALALLPALAGAQIYKCTDAQGRVNLTDKPCNGAAASPAQEITADIAPAKGPARAGPASSDKDWEAEQRFGYVELPAAERRAAELMASPSPEAQALGKELAWKAHLGRQAFEALLKARKSREEIDAKYDASRRKYDSY